MSRLQALKAAHKAVLESAKAQENEGKLMLVQPHDDKESSLSYSNISRFERLEMDY